MQHWSETMNNDARLEKAISRLNGKQSNDVILTLRDADIARLARGVTINRAIKDLAKNQADKQVKKALIELARHKDTIDGVDFMFNTGFGL